MTSRRRLLAGGLASAVLLITGGGLVLQPTVIVASREALRALDSKTFSILAAAADAICPGGEGLPTAWQAHVPERVDAHLDRLHPADVAELKQALLLLESGAAGLALDGRPRVFSALDVATRQHVLGRWQRSRLSVRRQAYRAIVALVAASYWSLPATHPSVGYPGPPRFGP